MTSPRYPSLYQVNTRVWLTELSEETGRTATLDDIADEVLDYWREQGFDWIWLLSVWQTGPKSREVSRTHAGWRRELEETLSDLKEDDIPGSGFAVADYRVHRDLGGDEALARLRARMQQRGLKLMLDFVPNHMGLDHPWVDAHPDYFIVGTDGDLEHQPQNYTRLSSHVFAYGRDPYFDGWPDTLQLNYAHPATQEAMRSELERIAGQCDGVRCDMAMLLLPDVFERTWGRRPESFWPKSIERVRQSHPEFVFMAEVYWDLEWTLQQQGFNFAYDKRLYDRLREGHARPVREHFLAGLDYQDRLARFLENHDEPRAAATFADDVQRAAAVVTFLSPGLRFFHQGQFEGRLKRISPHLGRAPVEVVNFALYEFYERLLELLKRPVVRDGDWHLLQCRPVWDGNWTADEFIAFGWTKPGQNAVIVVVNFADHQSQCRIPLPIDGLPGASWRLTDLLSGATYVRDGNELQEAGLFVDHSPWQACVFEVQRLDNPDAR